VSNGENTTRQRFLEDQCALHTRSKASLRASLHLDLVGAVMTSAAADESKDDVNSSAASPAVRKLKPSQVSLRKFSYVTALCR
jgi:hypothetical protein